MKWFLFILLAFVGSAAFAQSGTLDCKSASERTFISFRSYRIFSSYISVAGLRHYRWKGDEPELTATDLAATVGDFPAGIRFRAFEPARTWAQTGASRLYIDSGLMQGSESGVVVELTQKGLNFMECVKRPVRAVHSAEVQEFKM